MSLREMLGDLAVVQAIHSATGEVVSTRDPGNLRGQVDAEARRLFEEEGGTSFQAVVNGVKVGTFSIITTKPEEERREAVFAIKDPAALARWDIDPDEAVEWARDRIGDFARWHFTHTGELPAGCEVEEIVSPAHPGGEWKSSRLTVDAGKVAEAMRDELGGVARALLEGRNDG